MDIRDCLFRSDAPRATILIRIVVGWVFLSEGIQKFLVPGELGVGRFAKIGIPAPGFTAPFVGVVEIVFGALLIAGLLTRLAAIPLIIDISVAIATTKIPLGIQKGFWAAMHEARTDFAMLLGAIFLLIVGAGPWSVDARVRGGVLQTPSSAADPLVGPPGAAEEAGPGGPAQARGPAPHGV